MSLLNGWHAVLEPLGKQLPDAAQMFCNLGHCHRELVAFGEAVILAILRRFGLGIHDPEKQSPLKQLHTSFTGHPLLSYR
jgi:hypothetical protein